MALLDLLGSLDAALDHARRDVEGCGYVACVDLSSGLVASGSGHDALPAGGAARFAAAAAAALAGDAAGRLAAALGAEGDHPRELVVIGPNETHVVIRVPDADGIGLWFTMPADRAPEAALAVARATAERFGAGATA